MLKIKTILSLSFLIFLLPFLGFPQAFDNFLYVVFGVIIFIQAYFLKQILENSNDENTPQQKQESGRTDDRIRTGGEV